MLDYFKIFEKTKYCKLYKECDQTSIYHEEGSVYNHTKMVYAFVKENFFKDKDLEALLLGAICHDVGKIYTCEYSEKHQRNTFYFHEQRGFFLVRDVIKEMKIQISQDVLRKVLLITGYHDVYKYDIETLKQMFEYEDLKLLLKFTKCDTNGRISDKKHEIFDYQKLKYYKKESQPKKCIVYMTVGLPGAGKSTLSEYLLNSKTLKPLKVVSRDKLIEDFRSDSEYQKMSYSEKFKFLKELDGQKQIDICHDKLLQKYYSQREDFIIDETNISSKSRRKKLHGSTHFKKVCFILSSSVFECIERREKSDKKVSKDVIYDMWKHCSLPTLKDFDEIIII